MRQSMVPLEEFWSACFGGAPVPVHRQSGGLFPFPPVTYTHSANCAEDRHGVFLVVCWDKVSIRLYVRWVTFAWCLAFFTLRVSVRGLSCRTAEGRGVSTGAVLELVATCPSVCRTAEARGDSTGAVLGQGCLHARCVQTVLGPDVQKTVVFHSCSLDNVADVSARAVHRPGVDVPVFMQRPSLALGRCHWFSSSLVLVDIPVCMETGGSARSACDEGGLGAHHTGDELN